jgi:hypothetical protein
LLRLLSHCRMRQYQRQKDAQPKNSLHAASSGNAVSGGEVAREVKGLDWRPRVEMPRSWTRVL